MRVEILLNDNVMPCVIGRIVIISGIYLEIACFVLSFILIFILFFRPLPDQPWGPPSLLYNMYLVSLPEIKRPGHGAKHPPPSRAEVKERVELYIYSSSGPT
jgi:hypothetical protein